LKYFLEKIFWRRFFGEGFPPYKSRNTRSGVLFALKFANRRESKRCGRAFGQTVQNARNNTIVPSGKMRRVPVLVIKSARIFIRN
jgi:hypothetical protein